MHGRTGGRFLVCVQVVRPFSLISVIGPLRGRIRMPVIHDFSTAKVNRTMLKRLRDHFLTPMHGPSLRRFWVRVASVLLLAVSVAFFANDRIGSIVFASFFGLALASLLGNSRADIER